MLNHTFPVKPQHLNDTKILALAFEKETQARNFYRDLEVHCSVDFVSELLLKLQNEESKHMKLIQEMADRLGAGRPLT